MILIVKYPALECLVNRRDSYRGRLVLLSYNYSKHAWHYPCGHATDEVRVYRCPPELKQIAKRFGVLAQSQNKRDVIVFDPRRLESDATCRVTDMCPRCLMAKLLPCHPSCVMCGARIRVGDPVILRMQTKVNQQALRTERNFPVTAMTVERAGKTYFLGCVYGECAKSLRRSARVYVFQGETVSSVSSKRFGNKGSYIQDNVGEFGEI